MNPDAIAAAVLIGPGALAGAVCLAGHHTARRRAQAVTDACAAFQPSPPPGQPLPEPQQTGSGGPLAAVVAFPDRRRIGPHGQQEGAA
ncbi:hypothetical protein [Streptomyces lincolnensis]|uniref:hypothetical protein n=1 Tax=Streptomyces lincolnensis TaxID=1915 RepID=UPI0008358A8D|nr:hypothetical protein [Streptomyces lincolnensis]QMV09616.1 hypothetical protein GJU35_30830 [Streptomyces lincolnensis]